MEKISVLNGWLSFLIICFLTSPEFCASSQIKKHTKTKCARTCDMKRYTACASNNHKYKHSDIILCSFEKESRFYRKEAKALNDFIVNGRLFEITAVKEIGKHRYDVTFKLPVKSEVVFDYNVTIMNQQEISYNKSVIYETTSLSPLHKHIIINPIIDFIDTFYIDIFGYVVVDKQMHSFRSCAVQVPIGEMNEYSHNYEIYSNQLHMHFAQFSMEYNLQIATSFGTGSINVKPTPDKRPAHLVIDVLPANLTLPAIMTFRANHTIICDEQNHISVKENYVVNYETFTKIRPNKSNEHQLFFNTSECDLLLFVNWFSNLDKVCYSETNKTIFFLSNVLTASENIILITNESIVSKRPVCKFKAHVFKNDFFCFDEDAIIHISLVNFIVKIFKKFLPFPMNNSVIDLDFYPTNKNCSTQKVLGIIGQTNVTILGFSSNEFLKLNSFSENSSIVMLRVIPKDTCFGALKKFSLIVDVLDANGLEANVLDNCGTLATEFYLTLHIYCNTFTVHVPFKRFEEFYVYFKLEQIHSHLLSYFKIPFVLHEDFDGDGIIDELHVVRNAHKKFVIHNVFSTLLMKDYRDNLEYFWCDYIDTKVSVIDVNSDGFGDVVCTLAVDGFYLHVLLWRFLDFELCVRLLVGTAFHLSN